MPNTRIGLLLLSLSAIRLVPCVLTVLREALTECLSQVQSFTHLISEKKDFSLTRWGIFYCQVTVMFSSNL
jgi:hypothetical protein